ncbi:DNA cytosine methyltransferase [Methylocaldum gracile]
MPVVIDLFSGVGGLSLGAARAGFELAGAVDTDQIALETHAKNFPASAHIPLSVAELSGEALLKEAGVKPGGLDGLIGGPPCQGFSFIGKRDVGDARNELFGHFFRLVSETRPKFFLAENVPGIEHSIYDDIRERAFSLIRDNYVLLPPIEVKAESYGAPTARKRIFFVGYDPKYVRDLDSRSFDPSPDIPATCVGDGLEGLPEDIDPSWSNEESGWRPVGKIPSGFFGDRVRGKIPAGVGDDRSIERYAEKGEVSACLGTKHTKEVEERFSRLAWGETDKVSRAMRLHPKKYCPTIRAGTGPDRGSYQALRPIHHNRPRVITPREAARLQGFPDWFVFHPTKWHSFRQVGNSVSPVVSESLLSTFFRAIT